MEVVTVDFVEGAKAAQGVAIVIDVFRAFSTAAFAFANQVERIIPVGEASEALRLAETIPHSVLIGERGGKKLEGFDFGNSPTELQDIDLSGKTVIHTTHAGTQGLVNANCAEAVFTGAFVNAAATVRAVKELKPEIVTLVRMGFEAREQTAEDNLCAEYLKSLLTGTPFDAADVEPTLRVAPDSARFFNPENFWSPPSDFYLCLQVDRFDFALQAHHHPGGYLYLARVDPKVVAE